MITITHSTYTKEYQTDDQFLMEDKGTLYHINNNNIYSVLLLRTFITTDEIKFQITIPGGMKMWVLEDECFGKIGLLQKLGNTSYTEYDKQAIFECQELSKTYNFPTQKEDLKIGTVIKLSKKLLSQIDSLNEHEYSYNDEYVIWNIEYVLEDGFIYTARTKYITYSIVPYNDYNEISLEHASTFKNDKLTEFMNHIQVVKEVNLSVVQKVKDNKLVYSHLLVS